MTPVLASIVLLSASGLLATPEPQSVLVTAAASSTRPAECAARGEAGRAPSIWERARTPQRAAFCRAIAHSHARLKTDPEGAREAMNRAESAWPGRAATRVVDARLKLAQGDTPGALAAFDEAVAIEPRSVLDPATLRDHARALARGGRRTEALVAYRALAPQAALLPGPARAEALVEAALVSMNAMEPAAREIVAIRVGEALALLREARTLGPTPTVGETALVYALALDRAGDVPGASRELADAVRLGASLDRARALASDPSDEVALGALLAETTDRSKAAVEWDRYVSSSGSATWRAAAEKRRETLRGASGAGGPTQGRASSPRQKPARADAPAPSPGTPAPKPSPQKVTP